MMAAFALIARRCASQNENIINSPGIHHMAAKLIVTFERLSEADFQVKTNVIATALTDNPHFGLPWASQVPQLAELRAGVTDYISCYHASLSRDTQKIALRNKARQALTAQLKQVAVYLELVAQGDEVILASTGFDLRRDGARRSSAAASGTLPAPTDVRIGQVGLDGSLELSVARVPGAVAYEVQTSQGDPVQDTDWQHALTSASAQRIRVEGLKPGRAWARLRGVGRSGNGEWSQPVAVMVGG